MPDALPKLMFYCDESSYTATRFAAVSGILLREERVADVEDEIKRLKLAHGKREISELKWANLNKKEMPLYRDIVAYFDSLLKAKLIRFHVVVCDMHTYDHRRHNQGMKTTTVSKTYYQLLLHRCCRLYGGKALVHVRPDTGDCTRALPGLQNALNMDAMKRFKLGLPPIASINPTHSHSSNVMQMNDVILGGIASHRNERHKQDGASPLKTELAEAVRVCIGVPNFTISTSWESPATVWNWKGK